MAPAELTNEWTLNLIGSNGSQQEFFALPDMQCDGVPARGLVLGEVLEGIAPVGGDIINKRDVIRYIGSDRLRIAPTVVRLTRMSTCGRLVPAEHLVVVLGMAFANLGIVLGAPDVTFDAEVLLPKLVDQAHEGPKETFFHRSQQRTKALRVGLIFLEDGRQTHIPLAQRLLLRVRNVAKVVRYKRLLRSR